MKNTNFCYAAKFSGNLILSKNIKTKVYSLIKPETFHLSFEYEKHTNSRYAYGQI